MCVALMSIFAAILAALATATPVSPAAAVGRWSSHGPFGGAVYAIAIDPTDPQVAYASLGSIYTVDDHRIGGVFKTFDGGSSWKEIGPPDTSFFSVAVAPSDPRVVFASSDEGLWKSVNRGVDWSLVLPGVSGPAPPAIEPADALHVWVVSDGAAWRTIDGGSTWTRMFERAEAVGLDSGRPSRLHRARHEEVRLDAFVVRFAYSDDRGETWSPSTTFDDGTSVRQIVSDPSDPNTLYTADESFRSVDRGVSWSPLPSEFLITDLVVDPLSSSSLYAIALNGGLVVSRDSGLTWTKTLDVSGRSVAAAAFEGRTRIFAGSSQGLYFSDDGETWIASNEGLRGASWHALALDPRNSSRIYAVGRTGFAASSDGGATWTADLTSPASGGAIAVSPSEPALILASGAGIVRSRDGGATWQTAFAPSGSFTSAIVFDPGNASVVYATGFFPLKSTDGGESWRIINNGTDTIGLRTIAIDSGDSAILYASYNGSFSGGLFRSLDAGESWNHDPGPEGAFVQEAVLPDPGRPGVVWLGAEGGLFRGSSSDTTWIQTGFTEPVTAVAADGSAGGALYVASGTSGVFRSLDEGVTWEPMGTGLPRVRVYALLADTASGVLYAAANDGVYSLDLRRRPRVIPPR